VTSDTFNRNHLRKELRKDLIEAGILLKAARLRKGIQKKDIAARLQVSELTVWRIENGYPCSQINILYEYAAIVNAAVHLRVFVPLPKINRKQP